MNWPHTITNLFCIDPYSISDAEISRHKRAIDNRLQSTAFQQAVESILIR